MVAYGYVLNDPPAQQAAAAIAEAGFDVSIVQVKSRAVTRCERSESFHLYEVEESGRRSLGPLARWARWRRFQVETRRVVEALAPDLVVTIMLHALAALPKRLPGRNPRLVSCVYDVPAPSPPGRLDRMIFPHGWARLREADVVWSSDAYKAQLVEHIAGLGARPIVCHNCPPKGYIVDPTWPRDPWLRLELRAQGASVGESGGCIVLRAGAIGEGGGLEETLEAMLELPRDHILLMMGRPSAAYMQHMLERVAALGLQRRAFLWDRPSDEVWKRALRGADVGHLIHRPTSRYAREVYERNSSLSNNRLFQYMAAGLPIIAYDDPRMDRAYQRAACFRVARLARIRSDVTEIWKELGANPDLRRELGAQARRAHLETYCWENQFSPVLSAIKEMPT